MFVLLLAACGYGSQDATAGEPAAPITRTAPEESAVDLAAYRGRPVIAIQIGEVRPEDVDAQYARMAP